MLKITDIELDLIPDIYIYLFIEKKNAKTHFLRC